MKGIFLVFFCIFLQAGIKCLEVKKDCSKSYKFIDKDCEANLIKIPQRDADAIDGGETVEINKAPDQVAILKDNGHWCGGTMLSKRTVLTAAHCVKCSKCDFKIRAGSSFKSSGGLVVKVQNIIVHPKYTGKPSYDYDYALLILNKVGDRDFPDVVRHAKLPAKDDKIEVGQLMQVAGWGYISMKIEEPEQLQLAKVPIYDTDECKKAYGRGNITERMICAGYSEGKIDSCTGNLLNTQIYDKPYFNFFRRFWGRTHQN
jgi:trypsin